MSNVVFVPVYIDKWKAMTEALPEAERNRIMAAYLDYAVYDKDPKNLTKLGKTLFLFLKSTADDLKKDKGGAPRDNQNARKKQPVETTEKQLVVSKTKPPVNSTEKTTKNNSFTKAETKAKTETETETETEVCAPLTPQGETDTPTLDDVRKFAKESGLNVNPDRFYKYYKATGWMRKGDPIRDWKSLMESWTEPETPPEPKKPYHPVEKLTECPLCHSTDVKHRGLDGICYACENNLAWSTSKGEWIGEGGV